MRLLQSPQQNRGAAVPPHTQWAPLCTRRGLSRNSPKMGGVGAGRVTEMAGQRVEVHPRVTFTASRATVRVGKLRHGRCPAVTPILTPTCTLSPWGWVLWGAGWVSQIPSTSPGEPVRRPTAAQPPPRRGHRGHRLPRHVPQHPAGQHGGVQHNPGPPSWRWVTPCSPLQLLTLLPQFWGVTASPHWGNRCWGGSPVSPCPRVFLQLQQQHHQTGGHHPKIIPPLHPGGAAPHAQGRVAARGPWGPR